MILYRSLVVTIVKSALKLSDYRNLAHRELSIVLSTIDTALTDSFVALSQNCGKMILAPSCLSIRPSARNNWTHTKRVFVKFDISVFFWNASKKVKFHYNLTRITGTSHEYLSTFFFIISRSVLHRMRNVSDKIRREYRNTQFVFSHFFFLKNRAVYGIMWKIAVQPDMPHGNIIRRMRIACWKIKTQTYTQNMYVVFIASPQQEWLPKAFQCYAYTHIVCLVYDREGGRLLRGTS